MAWTSAVTYSAASRVYGIISMGAYLDSSEPGDLILEPLQEDGQAGGQLRLQVIT
jgi:hypothetical protein